MTKTSGTTGAQVRGQVQSGVTGDIRPGFDPAAAPLETDSEAGGAPLTPEQVTDALENRAGDGEVQQSYDVAMREPGSAATSSQTGKLFPFLALIVVLIAMAIGLAVASWLQS
jgi:hypothetical protein